MGCINSKEKSPFDNTPANLPDFPSFKGATYKRGGENYETYAYQYATSSQPINSLQPGAIVYANGYDDIKMAIKYARAHNIGIAVRSGGHQYLGFSSTRGDNIQLDMSNWLEYAYDEATNEMVFGPGWLLIDVNEKMQKAGTFVPHGECMFVHMGGHTQTGGYSLLSRSFGLMVDHVKSIEIVIAKDDEPEVKTVYRPNLKIATDPDNDELWFSVIGGSPGNFGIVTKTTLLPLKNADFPLSIGYQVAFTYNNDLVRDLLQVAADDACNDDLPADYGLSILCVGSSQLPWFYTMDKAFYEANPQVTVKGDQPPNPPMVLVTANYTNMGGAACPPDATVKAWFDKLRHTVERYTHNPVKELIESLKLQPVIKIPLPSSVGCEYWDDDKNAFIHTSVSELMEKSTWHDMREWPMPFEKRVFVSTRMDLNKNGYVGWCAQRIKDLEEDLTNGCKIGSQFAPMGGKHSRLRINGEQNPTALGWRNASMNSAFDAFYQTHKGSLATLVGLGKGDPWPEPKKTAVQFGLDNDTGAWGADGKSGYIGGPQKTLMYAPHGSHVLDDTWMFYFDTEEVWNKVKAAKKKFDPKNVFTPNPFCAGASELKDRFPDLKDAAKAATSTAPSAIPMGHDGIMLKAHHAKGALKKSVMAPLLAKIKKTE